MIGESNDLIIQDNFANLKEPELPDRWVAIADLSRRCGSTTEALKAYLPIIEWKKLSPGLELR